MNIFDRINKINTLLLFLVVVSSLASVVDSFQKVSVPCIRRQSRTRWVLSSSSSSTDQSPYTSTHNSQNDDDKTTSHGHLHEFWGSPRSKEQVQAFVEEKLSSFVCSDEDDSNSSNPRVVVLSADPPLVLIHDFLPDKQCQEIIHAAQEQGGMKLSTTGETQQKSTSRTSSTVWLEDQDCPGPLRIVAEKVSLLSGLPTNYMENLQVCRYQAGEQFKLHTDHQESFNSLDLRGRLATFLMYLDEPEKGGDTWFPCVREPKDLFVQARKGSGVFFWNTVEKPGSDNYEPNMFLNADMRLRHAGLPVLEGEKWICNRWIHPVDFGCGVVGTSGTRAKQQAEV